MVRTISIIAAVILLAGCCDPQYIVRPLNLPPRPNLPTIKESELQCLTSDTYKKLVERDRLRKNYAETCEAVVNSTHSK